MQKIKQFFNDCWAELKKVVWPDKNERMGATWIVLISVVILTAIVWLLDYAYMYAINRLLV